MTQQLAGAISTPPLGWRHGSWRSAFSGLTLHILATVAALVFARVLSGALVDDARTQDFAGFLAYLGKNFVNLSLSALPMLLAIAAAANLGPQQGTKRFVVLATAVVLSAGAAVFLRIASTDLTGLGPGWSRAAGFTLAVLPRYVLLGGMLTVAFEFQRRETRSVMAMQQAAVDRAALEREMSESRLRVLQAQIEPHFLFNTLATVRRLYETDHLRASHRDNRD